MEKFEDIYNLTEVKRLLFNVLYKSNEEKNRYFITNDQIFVKTFNAASDDEAIAIFLKY